MILEHIAVWTRQLEVMKEFYVNFFKGVPGPKYTSEHEFKSLFESYFLSFDAGSRLELMQMVNVADNSKTSGMHTKGLTHIAFSLNTIEEVQNLTERIRRAGYIVKLEPHYTGDDYFESCILDPDGNEVEIIVPPAF